MDMEALITEKIAWLQDLNREMQKINNEIGALQEKGRAFHQQALTIKGALDVLADVKSKLEEEAKSSETAKLILPEGVKPIIPETANNTEATPGDKAPTTLEVVK